MERKHWVGLVALGVVLIAAAGCFGVVAGAAAGAGAVAYIRGELEATEEAPMDKVVAAAKGAVDDLQLRLISSDADAVSGKITAETARGTDIGIALERESDNVTKIRIRVGVFGDENLSRLIHEKMKARLSAA